MMEFFFSKLHVRLFVCTFDSASCEDDDDGDDVKVQDKRLQFSRP